MKRLTLLYSLAAMILLGICEAQAGVYLEPFLGYGVNGELNQSGNSNEWDAGGVKYGARLGWKTMGLSFGGEYLTGKTDIEITTPGASGDLENTLSLTHMGIFAGYELPIMLRFFATYYVSSKAEGDEGGAGINKGDELSGSGYAVGAGYTALPFVSLNLQYQVTTYDEMKNSAGVPYNLSGDIEVKELILSVSFPF